MQLENGKQHCISDPLQDSEVLLRAMVENLPGGAAFVVDSELRYRLAEGEALSTAGFKPADLVGRTIFEVLPPDLATRYEGLYRKALAGEPFEHEHNAHDRFYISRGTPLRSANGEVYAVLAVSYDITDRKRVEAERKQAEAAAAADLEDMQRLRELSTRLVAEDNFQTLYQEIVATAIALTRADAGSVQILDEATQDFLLLAAQGFEQTMIERFYRVNASSNTSCGMTLAAGDRTFIDFDGPQSKDLDASIRWHFEAGYLSAQSTPLISRSGKVIGMVSTLWRKHHRPSDRELRFLDLLARQVVDLIEQRQAQVTLRESEEKYRSLFNSIDEGYFLIDVIFDETNQPVDLFYVEANQAAIAMTGQDFTGRRLSEINPNYEPFWYEIFGRVARTGKSERLERYAQPDQKWYDFYVVKVGNASDRRIAVVFQDITDRKQAEEKLHRAAEMDAFRVKLSDALRSLTDPVEIQAVAARVLGEHLGANQVHYGETIGEYVVISQGYGNGLPPMVGRFRFIDFGERLIADYRAGRISLSPDVVNDPNLTESERQVITGAGFRAYIAVPLTKAEGWVATLAVHSIVPHDWTTDEVELVQETAERTWAAVERARAEKALRESEIERIREQSAREQERQRAEALTELDRAKTVFFSNVSHEFRTPLTLMLAPLQDALSDSSHPLASPHRERLNLAHRNSLRLLKLVNTLLDFSRIEAGRMEAIYEPTDLAMFTTELASVFRSAIERAGLRLTVDCPSLPELVYIDQEMWEKIILNLLSNAFKFTFEGEITLSIRAESHVVLEVRDTGVGIPSDELPHLFERFYQVRGTQARTYEGSGIGLALVNELVRLHGGTIKVSSTVGQGSCFTIALPFGTEHLPNDRLQPEGDRIQPTRTLASTAINAALYVKAAEPLLLEEDTGTQGHEDLENSTVSPSPRLPLSVSPSARVLLVDDNADMREYLTRILSEHVQVDAVADGRAALAAAQAQVPDLIVSDVMMPELDGFGLLQALRADLRIREVPIILLSARAGEEAIVEGLEAGADDYLIKPFSAQELVSRVNAHLQMAQLRGEALNQAKTTIRRKDELLSTVSHELNTPLVSILGWTRLLRTNPPSPAMLTKALDTIERNATLQAKLVQDLLDISRLTTNKLRLQLQPVELKAVIETAIASIQHLAEAKGIGLVWCSTGQGQTVDAVVMGDSDRLQQVICNLLTNAVKFTPEGGRVEVQLITHAISQPDYAEIRVTDTGIGISADFLPHVFDRFRQARDSDSENGLGLGLAIAHHLVELHNGTIHAESAGEGKGSTLIVRLPFLPLMDA